MAEAPAAGQATRSGCRTFLGVSMRTEPTINEPFAERHYTVKELAAMWRPSGEFVRKLLQHEPGVTEWV